ncbi:MAG TPA: AAA family ATPase, partial [Actinomycetota bacterium]|nr:AAA family ATPase [Actinomycetota bacterium]
MRPHHPLIGRRSDRERLATFVDTLAGGTGAFVLVEGEAGIGKSAVLAEVVERALDRGMTAFI